MTEELRGRREQWNEGRLVYVAELRMKSAHDEIELVSKEPVVRISDEVNDEDQGSGDKRDASSASKEADVVHSSHRSRGNVVTLPARQRFNTMKDLSAE
jgi:hypothetical protein